MRARTFWHTACKWARCTLTSSNTTRCRCCRSRTRSPRSSLRECVRIAVGACLLYAPFPGTIVERRGHVALERGDDPADDAACVFLDGHDAPVAVPVAVPAYREWWVVVIVIVVVVDLDVVFCTLLFLLLLLLLWLCVRCTCAAVVRAQCVCKCGRARLRVCACVRAMRRACLPARPPAFLPAMSESTLISTPFHDWPRARTRTQAGTHVIVTRVLHSYCSRTHARTRTRTHLSHHRMRWRSFPPPSCRR